MIWIYTTKGEFLNKAESIYNAHKLTGQQYTNIQKNLNGDINQIGGYVFIEFHKTIKGMKGYIGELIRVFFTHKYLSLTRFVELNMKDK